MESTDVVELTIHEVEERLEAGARERFGLSAKKLMSRIRSGKMEWCDAGDLVILASLLPKKHPLYVPA